MAVGTDTLSFYEGEDVDFFMDVTDANVTDITGWTITFVVKPDDDQNDPADVTLTCAVYGSAPTIRFRCTGNIALSEGTYQYTARRTNAGFSWELARGELVVRGSVYGNY